MHNKLSIPGLPDFVKVTYHGSLAYAEVPMDAAERDLKGFVEALDFIVRLGFEYSYTSHNLGYYDSVEDITMEFSRKDSGDFIKKYKPARKSKTE